MNMQCPSQALLINFGLKSILTDIAIYTSLFPRSICLEYLFPTLNPEVMFILDVEVCFLHATEAWILFSYLFCQSISFHWEIKAVNIERNQGPMIVSPCYFVVAVGGGGGGSMYV